MRIHSDQGRGGQDAPHNCRQAGRKHDRAISPVRKPIFLKWGIKDFECRLRLLFALGLWGHVQRPLRQDRRAYQKADHRQVSAELCSLLAWWTRNVAAKTGVFHAPTCARKALVWHADGLIGLFLASLER